MDNRIPALVFGVFLMVTGSVMLWYQLRSRRASAEDFKLDPRDRRFLDTRNRRRIQVAGLIILIGVMFPVGDSLIPWKDAPTTFAIYWLIVLALGFWTMLLAVGDMLATRMHTNVSLDRLKSQQKDLEDAVSKIREQRKASSEESTCETR
ncbi:MAG: hypothetical protein R3C18_21820 [Planctomycetaceae bacterium]